MVKFLRIAFIIICVIGCIVYFGMTVNSWRTADADKPVVTMDEPRIVISIHDDESAILRGITAIDNQDGDVSDQLLVESVGNFTQDGEREVTIAAFDSAGNVTKVTRQISYSDYHSPRLHLTGPLSIGLNRNQQLLSRIRVQDCLDGDISGSVILTPESGYGNIAQILAGSVVGTYTMHLQFSNSAGDTVNIPVTVEFFNTNEVGRPELTLKEYILYVPLGTELHPVDYLQSLTLYSRNHTWDTRRRAFIWEDGDKEHAIPLDKIQIANGADTSTPGVYEILYSYTSDEGYKGTVRLIVVVEG